MHAKLLELLSMSERTVMHVDMDAFFASVEIVHNPSLKGKAVIVGGPDRRGVVSTCSYEARKFGVRSAMSMFEAKKKCPHAVFLEGNFALYREASEQVMEILHRFSPCVEVVGIDEAYLDLTQYQEFTPFKTGQAIRRAIFEKTYLTCSVGIGSNKLIAKIASSHAKPNGLFEVPAGCEKAFLAPLPIQSIPGIGIRTQAELNNDGIVKVADLQTLGMETLVHRYGTYGYYFYLACEGKDSRPVLSEDAPPKSVGAETTFDVDIAEREMLVEELEPLLEKAYRRLRRHKMRTRGLSLKLRFADFKTVTRSLTFDNHTVDYDFLREAAVELFDKVWPGTPLRLIGLAFEKLTDSYWQPTFWDWLAEQEREEEELED